MASVSVDSYTQDGGKILGEGWVEYLDPSSEQPFYVNDDLGVTQWTHPNARIVDFFDESAEENTSLAIVHNALGGGGGGGGSGGAEEGGGALWSTMPRNNDDESTDNSSDDEDQVSLAERARRLGGGFRTMAHTLQVADTPDDAEPGDEVSRGTPVLGESSLAMIAKLNETRAMQQGDVMTNQAAFKTDGMLMLESIESKGDPTEEAEGDAETIARLAGERVKMQEVRYILSNSCELD
jgi:hypothetical protein